ncbi:hypothetical protein ACFL1U_01420 [Patescibacteria group bacterium]
MSAKSEVVASLWTMFGATVLLSILLICGIMHGALTDKVEVVGIWSYLIIAFVAFTTLTTLFTDIPYRYFRRCNIIYMIYHLIIGIVCVYCVAPSYTIYSDKSCLIVIATYICTTIVSAICFGSLFYRLIKK